MSTPTVCIGTYKLTESALYEALVKGVDWIDTATAYNNCKMIGHASQVWKTRFQDDGYLSYTPMLESTDDIRYKLNLILKLSLR